MADLSEINLDESGEDKSTLSSHEEEFEVSSSPSSSGPESSHSKTEDIGLYFQQSWKARLGTTGIVIIAFLAIMLALSTALLIVSYTSMGRSFFQSLKFFIF